MRWWNLGSGAERLCTLDRCGEPPPCDDAVCTP